MKFTENQLENLRQNIKTVLSEKRFAHTVGVEAAVVRLHGYFPELDLSELRCAALLHDVTKEMPDEEQIELILSSGGLLSDSERASREILHSLSAPYMVRRAYPEFATENLLSALRNHTTAMAGMSLFDEIIYIADYVEDGRSYPACIAVRELLYSSLAQANSHGERCAALHVATLKSLENTINKLLFQGRALNERTRQAREYILGLLSKTEK